MAIPVAATITVIFLYAFCMFLVLRGLSSKSVRGKGVALSPGAVTVVVPFRDESGSLLSLLDDLASQNVAGGLFQVVLVNDHSTDGSAEIARDFAKSHSHFTCIELPEGNFGKKQAIAHGISQTSSEWIIQTDADCRLEPCFISSHMAFLESNPSDLVAGLVTTTSGSNGFLEAFERLDILALSGVGAGSFSMGRPVMCSGANLLYSKELFLETRRFDPGHKTGSGDDMFLMIGARKLGRKLSFNTSREAAAETEVVQDLFSLVRQRIRWGAKSIYYRMPDIQILAVIVGLANLAVLCAPVWMVVWPVTLKWFVPVLALKLLVDFLVLFRTARLTGQLHTLLWFIPVAILYYPYMAVVMAGSLIGSYSWKGRVR